MDTPQAQTAPAPPNLIRALTAGFDATTSHLGLLAFSLLIDLLLWLGPHLRLQALVEGLLARATNIPELQTPEMADALKLTRETWAELTQSLNLLSALRTLPIGIPSLMAGQPIAQTPLGTPFAWELPSLSVTLGVWLIIVLLGVLLGALYYDLVAQAALGGKVDIRQSFIQWSWTGRQAIVLLLIWVGLFFLVSFPASCLVSFSVMSGAGGVNPWLVFIGGGLVIWIFFPLLFSAHGIFVNRRAAWLSMREGARLTRLTMPVTGLFFIIVLILSEGLDVLWQQPPLASWLTLVGVVGHAFITTGLLAASFVYYRDADRWLQRLVQKQLLRQAG